MRIYRITDKISYKVGELSIKISPLSVHDKAILHDYVIKGQTDTKALIEGSMFALKAALKEVTGLTYSGGEQFKLVFDDNNYVTEDCISELMNIEESTKMIQLCSQLLSGIPKSLPPGISLVEDQSPNEQAKQKD